MIQNSPHCSSEHILDWNSIKGLLIVTLVYYTLSFKFTFLQSKDRLMVQLEQLEYQDRMRRQQALKNIPVSLCFFGFEYRGSKSFHLSKRSSYPRFHHSSWWPHPSNLYTYTLTRGGVLYLYAADTLTRRQHIISYAVAYHLTSWRCYKQLNSHVSCSYLHILVFAVLMGSRCNVLDT